MTIPDYPSADAWFDAQGQINGRPLLIRGRAFRLDLVPNPNFRNLLVIQCDYQVSSATGLPDDQQSGQLRLFETSVLSVLESRQLGCLAWVETCNGFAHYYCYVASVQSTVDWITDHVDPQTRLIFSADEDSAWTVYTAKLAGCKNR